MAHGRSLELAKIQPVDRVAKPMPASARRGRKERPHTRLGPRRDNVGLARGFHLPGGERTVFDPSTDPKVWHTTRRRPWDLKAQRRARNKAARLARRSAR